MTIHESLIDITKKHPGAERIRINSDIYKYLRENDMIIYCNKKTFYLGLRLIIDDSIIFAETE
jgi:hypothetical protein